MSKSDIQSWISAANASAAETDFDNDRPSSSSSSWQRDRVLSDWDGSMGRAQVELLGEKTKFRVRFLENELLPLAKHADLSLSQIMDIFKLLTLTYPRYADAASRHAVEAVGTELIRRDELRGTSESEKDESRLGVTEQIVGWLSNEVSRLAKRGTASSYASSDLFVLLGWTCGIYTVCIAANPDFTSSNVFRALIGAMAVLLDMLHGSAHAKQSLKYGGLVRVRRALRSGGAKDIVVLVSTLLDQAKMGSNPLRVSTLLGTAVSVLIRLKNCDQEPVARLPLELQGEVISAYSSNVLMSKIGLPDHVLVALEDFIKTFVTEKDFAETILPIMDKAVLRSPEISLTAITSFFNAYSRPLDQHSFRRVINQAINSAKSSNSAVRFNSVQLFRSLAKMIDSSDDMASLAVTELLALPKSSKTAGPDHRVALYCMLSFVPPLEAVAPSVVQASTPLLAKETHEAAVGVLTSALHPHFSVLLQSDVAIPKESVTLIVKEMGSSKPAVRRAFSVLAGSVFYGGDIDIGKGQALEFAKEVLPALENSLKSVAANPLNVGGGPLEGYVATALLLGPFANSGRFDDAIARNPVLSSWHTVGAKPLFLLWEKVYQKVTDNEDEKWLFRACSAFLDFFTKELSANEVLRVQLGLVFVHLELESSSPDVRREVLTHLQAAAAGHPELTNLIIRDGLNAFLARGMPVTASAGDETPKPWNKHSRLSALLLSVVAFDEERVDQETRRSLLAELVILAHHPLVCGPSRQTWIDCCQKGHADPQDLANTHMDKLLELIRGASAVDAKYGFAEASYSAVATLAFVSPATFFPRILEQLKVDLNPGVLNSLTDLDFGVWCTPGGTTYVDVLSSNKSEVRTVKGKDAEMSKWDEEVRKSLAHKKAGGGATLTKQQQALVSAQLEKEAAIRQRVAGIKANLERSLHFIKSLVASGSEDFKQHVSSVASLLLDGALGPSSTLVGDLAFDTYLDLAKCCSERLNTFRGWVAVATLRSLKVASVPEELCAEPLNLLVIRVLYRLRSLSEQAPLDSCTFAFAYPLLNRVLVEGGISPEEEDEALEQLALALGIIKFHCGEFSDAAFPRLQTLQDLVHVIRHQPRFNKEAASALIDLGEAIQATVSLAEQALLLRSTLVQESYARNACLQTLQPFDLTDLDWSPEILLACHDEDEQNARLARHLWDDNGLDVPESYLESLLGFLGHDTQYVRSSAADAIVEAVEHWPQSVQRTFSAIQDYYRAQAKILAPEFDEYGMVITQSLDRTDPWPARVAAAKTLELIAPYLTAEDVAPFFKFLIEDQALGDRSPDVRRAMLSAGTSVIDFHGAVHLADLITIFEEYLGRSTPATETDDQIKEAIVILFGRLARHLEATDPRIPAVVDRLVDALKTPAEQVQIAVSDCLSPLVKFIRPELASLVDRLFDDLFNGPKYAIRRGAAYGLAGVLKGTGIAGMKDFDVMSRLRAAAEDKKRYEARQGVMFAFETLSNTLGRLFEPYITETLPLLLASFGDATADVREATQDAARVIMGNLSGYGVKLILPSLLSGLEEKQWRTKKGSIELLGMMAYCSPRQLSLSLPIVIPRLTDVLTDSHAQVRAAANKSLKQFGEVINNPEIQSLVPTLLKALVDPGKTTNALSSLLRTSFVHYIDHSSLALVIPILERGLRERGAETKKKAAQIVGNLASLTDSKDFVPYLSELLPMVHQVLVDPVPEARATAAKALGTLVERLGEVHFPDLVPGLLRTLKTDTSGVDRQGAAQGLSEVLAGLGMERLEGLLPDIIANAQSPRATVREGFMSLLVYLPATFGTRFQPHLPKVVSPILSGLSDTEEYVREAAMRAGRMVITNYSSKAIDLLLPELEHGMFDPSWRIRQSSITLVGELLFKVSGISGKTSDLEEEEVAAEAAVAESSKKALVEVLGVERRDRILAALYIIRQDGVLAVRQSSLQIWKALVHNTPRTVREVLPELINQIIILLSSDEPEQQETAARTTTELCRKFGEKTLGDMIPILKAKSTSTDSRTRQGVCLTLCEIMQSSTDTQREGHDSDIIVMVREALVDDEADVRTAAAKAFDILQEHLGTEAIDQTIPTLLEALRQPGKGSGTALQALREVMSVRASTVFPVLIPTLTAIPMTPFNARALASLVTVAGNALSKRLSVILTALVKVSEGQNDEELQEALDEAIEALLSSISDAEGLNTFMMLLLGWAKHELPRRRVSALNFFATFCQVSDLDSSLYRVDWIRQLISSLEDSQPEVHKAASKALDVFVKSIPKDELESLVVSLRRAIDSAGGPGITLPGFNLPQGISPLVPIIIAGLTTGSNEQRENAAYAIGDLVERTEESAIKPYVVPFTGPLIRVATQATTYPPAVKTAILSALMTMLQRIPAFVKPFFPQLQRTFVKSTSDPASNSVRNKAAQALGVLMKHQPRVDPVVTELLTGIKSSDDAVSSSLVKALAYVVFNASSHMGDKAKEACIDLVVDAFRGSPSENYAEAIGLLVRSLSVYPDELRPIVQANLTAGTPQSILSTQVTLAVLSPEEDMDTTDSVPNLFQKLSLLRSVAQKVVESVSNERSAISRPARETRDILKAMGDPCLDGLF